jgi:hypothetical protein
MATKHYITPAEFDFKNHKIIPLDKTEEAQEAAGTMNMELLSQIGEYASRFKNSKEKVSSYTLPMLIKFLRDETDPTNFISLLEKKIKEKKAIGNFQYAESFDGTKNLLERMGYKVLPLDAITTPWGLRPWVIRWL